MFEIIREHQLNIMLALCAICIMMAVLLLVTRFLSKRRKWIMISIELTATFLLSFDRCAYIYKGNPTHIGTIMVRLSNFMVFFLTSAIVLCFNFYLIDLLLNEGKLKKIPKRLKAVSIIAAIGMLLVVISQFTGIYYYFDEDYIYHRGSGYLLSYAVPFILPVIQFTVVRQYKKRFSKLIYTSVVLYITLPVIVGIIQIFSYGISIITMTIVLVSISLYVLAYLDINNAAEKAHELEVGNLHKEQESMKRLFDQTVSAFVSAVEKHDTYSEGHSVRTAEFARRIAKAAGKSEEECEEVFYAALLHDVGMISLPDSVIQKTEGFTEEELRQKKLKPVMSAEILSNITEYPYLSSSVRYSHERYDGTGYPDGLKGKDIPDISRIIAAADAYDSMISGKRNIAPLSYQVVREEFIKQSGTQFDPVYAEIVVQLLDADYEEAQSDGRSELGSELICKGYRESVSYGISADEEIVKISFSCEAVEEGKGSFSAPSIIVFDSYDRHIHSDAKTIEAYRYLEYCELWFDGHYVSTNARNMAVKVTENNGTAGKYEITAGRFEDHISLQMISPERRVDIIIALHDISKASYIGLTGENCHIHNISVKKTGDRTEAGMIRQIVSKIGYTDRLESDIPNIQIDHTRNASTEGILIRDEVIIDFHTMSLPSANLVWHCPYIVIFTSEDKKVGGKGFREFALIKLNGESSGNDSHAKNTLIMKKSDEFPGWDQWKEKNKAGMECSVRIVRKGSRIIVTTENLGIAIENTTVISKKTDAVYAALTGDQVALTDIRIR